MSGEIIKVFDGSPQLINVVEVKQGMKQIALVVEIDINGGPFEALYRPEKGLIISISPQIPKPQELYRDVCFSGLDRILGWGVTAPVIPWALSDDDRGVLRPYWRNANVLPHYDLEKEIEHGDDYWFKVAILDFVAAVGDRVSNDFLLTDDGRFAVDSGYSFLSGDCPDPSFSIVRKILLGRSIPENLRRDLELKGRELGSYLKKQLPNNLVEDFEKRLIKMETLAKVI